MPRFTRDVFFSVDAADDRPAGAGAQSWASQIRRALELRLTALLGTHPAIVTSPASSASDAATLVCIVSDASRTSPECAAHRDAFIGAQGAQGAQGRIFTVLIAPVAQDQLPAALRQQSAFALFAPNSGTPADDKRFWMVIDDLAHALADAIGNRQREDDHAPAESGTRIYLAETSADLQEERDRIRRELQRHGHVVFPAGTLPDDAASAEREIREQLAQCALSINLIGAEYGRIPRGGTASVMELQHRLALEQCQRDPSFHHVIWIPPGLVSADPRQNAFLTSLRQFTEVERGTELVQSVLEDFKGLVEDKLRPAAAPAEPHAAPALEGNGPRVYLMYDQRDSATVAPLQEFALRLGIHVIPSVFEGDQTTLREIHQENLKTCDAALIVYGNVREPWVRIKQQDLLKAAGFGRSRQMLAKAIYVGPIENESKRRFDAQEVMVIKDFEAITPTSILPFFEKVRSASGGVSA